MGWEAPARAEPADEIVDVALQALGQPTPTDLTQVLRAAAAAIDAYGAILWELAPGGHAESSETRPLFTVGHWLADDRLPIHALPLQSVTGEAVVTQKTTTSDDILTDGRVFPNPFLTSAAIRTMCAVPITFHDGTSGALNIYRAEPRPFTPSEIVRVERLARVIPALYRAIRDRLSIDLLSRVSALVRRETSESPPSKDAQRWPGLDDLVQLISTSLRCRETSIFLEDPREGPGQFALVATSWPEWCCVGRYAPGDTGPTARALASGAPVNIFDLFEAAREPEGAVKPCASAGDDTHLTADVVRNALDLPLRSDLPPVSFMATPVFHAGRVVGVIRCVLGTAAPYRFARLELDLLAVVAGEIGHYWSSWLTRRDMEHENRSWRDLVQAISDLNVLVNNELAKPAPDEGRIFTEALKATATVVPGAEITDVRLLDEKTDELYFAYTRGSAWDEGVPADVAQRKARRFSIRSGAKPSAGALVFNTRKLFVIRDPKSEPFYDGTFPDVRRVIVAPITIEEKCFGVLDLRARADTDFPPQAETIAQLLGKQLGLYHYLVATIARMRQVEGVNLRTTNEHVQAFQDLGHQLKSPIIQASARAQAALKLSAINGSVRSHLNAVRGLSGKAVRVVKNTTLFAELARGKPITPVLKNLTADQLVKLLIEAATDYQLIVQPSRRVVFHVERETFDILQRAELMIDVDLLEQALSNVLDNAGKYSFDNSQVRIFGGLTGSGRFHVTVSNRGLPIRSQDVARCVQRGWRSQEAEWTTGEGSGIGLWIVDNILKAHGGDLVIAPTVRSQTEVKLVFPLRHT